MRRGYTKASRVQSTRGRGRAAALRSYLGGIVDQFGTEQMRNLQQTNPQMQVNRPQGNDAVSVATQMSAELLPTIPMATFTTAQPQQQQQVSAPMLSYPAPTTSGATFTRYQRR